MARDLVHDLVLNQISPLTKQLSQFLTRASIREELRNTRRKPATSYTLPLMTDSNNFLAGTAAQIAVSFENLIEDVKE